MTEWSLANITNQCMCEKLDPGAQTGRWVGTLWEQVCEVSGTLSSPLKDGVDVCSQAGVSVPLWPRIRTGSCLDLISKGSDPEVRGLGAGFPVQVQCFSDNRLLEFIRGAYRNAPPRGYSNSVIPSLGPREQSLRQTLVSYHFIGNWSPREYQEDEKEQGREGEYQDNCYWAGYHSVSRETNLSQDCPPIANGNAVFQDGQTKGRQWGEFIHYLPFPWFKALSHAAWTTLYFQIEKAWVAGGSCDVSASARAVRMRDEGTGPWHN